MPLETEVPKYDPNQVQDLLNEGYTESEAIRELSTTMDGANETPTGEIRSTQTMCDKLHYKETLKEPKEVRIARKSTKAQVREELGLSDGENVNKAVDRWIKDQEKKQGKATI